MIDYVLFISIYDPNFKNQLYATKHFEDDFVGELRFKN